MSDLFEIRRLTPADAEDYRTIRLDALKRDPDAFGSTYEAETSRPLSGFAERIAGTILFGVYAEGRIVAMAGVKQQDGLKDQHKGYVWGYYVQAEMRGRGIGAALMTALIAASHGIVEHLTLTVVKGNKPAIALYERFGFRAYGVEPRSLKTASGYADEILMIRLNPEPASP